MKTGKLDIEYSSSFLKTLCEALTSYKTLHSLRYTPLLDLFTNHTVRRKLNLFTPLYIVKKVFTT